MDIDRAREFARRHHHAVMATRTQAGIQQSPVLVAVNDEGRFVVSSRDGVQDPGPAPRPLGAAVLIGEKFFGTWDYVEGEAEVLCLPDAMEPLVDYYRRAAGEHDEWDDYRAGLERERRVLFRITPGRAGPDRQG